MYKSGRHTQSVTPQAILSTVAKMDDTSAHESLKRYNTSICNEPPVRKLHRNYTRHQGGGGVVVGGSTSRLHDV